MSQGNASHAMVGNGRQGPRMVSGAQAPGLAGRVAQQMCHFPAPPPKRVYCHPAPFSSLDGRPFFRLVSAYGSSVPAPGYY